MRMNDTNRPPFFPMMINLSGQKVLIVGGGNVASRRAFTLKKCGAEIVAVSPKFSRDFPPVAKRIEREFDPADLTSDFTLVIAATNSRIINHKIFLMAEDMNLPVNVSDCKEECTFFFPSMISCGSVCASVCSAGESPSLTHRLSERLRKVWPIWITDENNRKIR